MKQKGLGVVVTLLTITFANWTAQAQDRDSSKDKEHLDAPKHGKKFAANAPAAETIILKPTANDCLARIWTAIETGNYAAMDRPCEFLSLGGDERAIPKLIGLMDADNTPDVVRELGGGPLTWLTGVHYHPSRHGKWWRTWWQANKSNFPESVRKIEIPDYPKTGHGKQFAERIEGQPIVLDPTLDDLLKLLEKEVAEGKDASSTAEWIASYENPRAIEPLIRLIVEDRTGELKKSIGYSLKDLAAVKEKGFRISCLEFRAPQARSFSDVSHSPTLPLSHSSPPALPLPLSWPPTGSASSCGSLQPSSLHFPGNRKESTLANL